MLNDEVEDEEVRSLYDYVINLTKRLEHTCELAMKNLQKVQGKQKAYYDRRAKPRSFKVGDKVLLLLPNDSNKLLLLWRGPFEIVEVLNCFDYRVNVNGCIHSYHANILRLYVERKTEASHCLLSAEVSIPLGEENDEESDEYSLEDCTFPELLNCPTVQKGRVAKVPLGRLPLIDTPFKRVAVDIVGPIEPHSNNRSRYIFTMMDYVTRYPEAIALPSIETERVAEALVEMFSRVGVPDEMLTDCGSQFMSEIMKEVARLLSLQQLTRSAFNAQCNGLVE